MATNFNPLELGTTAKVAKSLGVGATTLTAAITAGHVESVRLGCGLRVVVIASARAWHASERKPGRRKASTVARRSKDARLRAKE